MKHYEYVSKNVARPYREEFEQIISELQNRLRSELNNNTEFRLSTLTSTSDAKIDRSSKNF